MSTCPLNSIKSLRPPVARRAPNIVHAKCPVLEEDRTWRRTSPRSQFEPEQTLGLDCRIFGKWQNLVPRVRLFFRRDQTVAMSTVRALQG
jgi:hypothetical protein